MSGQKFPALAPTRHFAKLAFLLSAVLYAAVSQNNGAAYVLLFLLTSVLLVSVLHTLLNLRGLKISIEAIKPAFAGQEISVPLEIGNQCRKARHAIEANLSNPENASSEVVDEIPPNEACRVALRFPAPSRGEHEISNVCLTSVYPLGFLQAKTRVAARQRYLVYPKPAGNPKLPITAAHSTRQKFDAVQPRGDEFAGVRAYMPGESQRHVDWKAVARGQPMMTKQFAAAETGNELHLDFAKVPLADTEQRLSQLALWIIEAERAQRRYSLRLPSAQILPSLGEAHFHHCLRALALFQK